MDTPRINLKGIFIAIIVTAIALVSIGFLIAKYLK